MSSARAPGRAERGAFVGLVLFVVCLLPFAGSSIYNNDEFTALSHAHRLLAGEVLYRDFFEFIPPLPLWLLAGVGRVFGASLITMHVLAACVIAVSGIQLFVLARRLGVGPVVAWTPAFMLAFGGYAHWAVYSHHWVVLPFELGALLLASRGLAGQSLPRWLGVGACVGLAGLCMQTDGTVLGLVLALGLGLDGWQRREPWRHVALRLAGLVGGALLVGGVAAGVLAWQGALGAAYDDLVRWPLTQYRLKGGINDVDVATDLPTLLLPLTARPVWYFRVLHELGLYALGLAAVSGSCAWGLGWLRARWQGIGGTERQGLFAMLGLWAIACLALAIHGRADYVHVTEGAIPAFLWLTVGASRLAALPVGPNASFVRLLPLAALVAYLGTGALGQLKILQKEPWLLFHPGSADARLTNSEIIRYLRAHMRPGDRMAAMPYGGFFYVYGLAPASRYTLMFPPEMGYGSAQEFEAFWAEIARRRPRFIVIAPWAWAEWAATLRQYTDHLPPRYHLVGSFGSPQYDYAFPALVYEADEDRR